MAFALVKLPHFHFDFSVCASSRVTMYTGLRADHHGVQGNVTAQAWVDAGKLAETLPRWLRRAGYQTYLRGKFLNRCTTDTIIIPGYTDYRAMVDDSALGGAHADHAMRYLDFYLNTNGSLSQQTAGDTWTGADKVGYTPTAAANRIAAGSSSYQTDWANRRVQTDLDTIVQPFYIDIALWGCHADSSIDRPIPAARHAAASFTATHNPSWDEDVADKPKWVRDVVAAAGATSGLTAPQKTAIDAYDVEAKRTALAIDEAAYDIVSKLTTLGLIDSTDMYFFCDNGTMLGDHRLSFETAATVKNVPYLASNRSVLYVHRGTAPGRHNIILFKMDDMATQHFTEGMPWLESQVVSTNNALVSNLDLVPTWVETARARATLGADGMSLLPLLDGRVTNWRDHLLIQYSDPSGESNIAELPDFYGVVHADGRKYIRYAAKGGDPAETEYYSAAAVAADELVASSTPQPDLEAAIDAMVAG